MKFNSALYGIWDQVKLQLLQLSNPSVSEALLPRKKLQGNGGAAACRAPISRPWTCAGVHAHTPAATFTNVLRHDRSRDENSKNVVKLVKSFHRLYSSASESQVAVSCCHKNKNSEEKDGIHFEEGCTLSSFDQFKLNENSSDKNQSTDRKSPRKKNDEPCHRKVVNNFISNPRTTSTENTNNSNVKPDGMNRSINYFNRQIDIKLGLRNIFVDIPLKSSSKIDSKFVHHLTYSRDRKNHGRKLTWPPLRSIKPPDDETEAVPVEEVNSTRFKKLCATRFQTARNNATAKKIQEPSAANPILDRSTKNYLNDRPPAVCNGRPIVNRDINGNVKYQNSFNETEHRKKLNILRMKIRACRMEEDRKRNAEMAVGLVDPRVSTSKRNNERMNLVNTKHSNTPKSDVENVLTKKYHNKSAIPEKSGMCFKKYEDHMKEIEMKKAKERFFVKINSLMNRDVRNSIGQQQVKNSKENSTSKSKNSVTVEKPLIMDEYLVENENEIEETQSGSGCNNLKSEGFGQNSLIDDYIEVGNDQSEQHKNVKVFEDMKVDVKKEYTSIHPSIDCCQRKRLNNKRNNVKMFGDKRNRLERVLNTKEDNVKGTQINTITYELNTQGRAVPNMVQRFDKNDYLKGKKIGIQPKKFFRASKKYCLIRGKSRRKGKRSVSGEKNLIVMESRNEAFDEDKTSTGIVENIIRTFTGKNTVVELVGESDGHGVHNTWRKFLDQVLGTKRDVKDSGSLSPKDDEVLPDKSQRSRTSDGHQTTSLVSHSVQAVGQVFGRTKEGHCAEGWSSEEAEIVLDKSQRSRNTGEYPQTTPASLNVKAVSQEFKDGQYTANQCSKEDQVKMILDEPQGTKATVRHPPTTTASLNVQAVSQVLGKTKDGQYTANQYFKEDQVKLLLDAPQGTEATVRHPPTTPASLNVQAVSQVLGKTKDGQYTANQFSKEDQVKLLLDAPQGTEATVWRPPTSLVSLNVQAVSQVLDTTKYGQYTANQYSKEDQVKLLLDAPQGTEATVWRPLTSPVSLNVQTVSQVLDTTNDNMNPLRRCSDEHEVEVPWDKPQRTKTADMHPPTPPVSHNLQTDDQTLQPDIEQLNYSSSQTIRAA